MDRRRMLWRSAAAMGGLASSGLLLSLGQEPEQHQARNMITGPTQEAIDQGLAYLAANQNPDGSFGTANHRGNVAITALGGLAFMAGGHQPGRGRYGPNVRRALEFMLTKEDPNTRGFLTNAQGGLHGPMYGHGFATLFLAEVYGMVPDVQLRDRTRGTLKRAVELLIHTQNHQGGWRYHPVPRDADLSVTICQIMALRAARNAGITVPKTVADKCIEYVKNCQDRQSGGFCYQPHLPPPGFARTAAGVVALYSAGVYEDESVTKGLTYLMRFKPGAANQGLLFNPEVQIHYYYGHYYAVQAMWIAGARYFREWYPAIRDELLSTRMPTGAWSNGQFCPHYCTAMALIILQVPNNYLPILQR